MSEVAELRENVVDIAIVGAGMVGAALALALKDSGHSVLLVDAQTQDALGVAAVEAASVEDFEPRVSALTPVSQALLEKIGAWDELLLPHSSPYRRMEVWDALGTARIDFDARELYRDELGFIVENRHLVAAMHRKLAASDALALSLGVLVKAFERIVGEEEERYRLSLSDGTIWSSRLLVAADGAQSRVRQWAGLPSREWDYEHRAIVATVKTEYKHALCARQRFSESGPLAFLPLQDTNSTQQYCSIVWSLVPERANHFMSLSNEEFAAALSKEFESELGQVLQVSKRYSLPLRQRHAKEYVNRGVVLVGDAAHTIHPLAGQGVNLGFKDVQVLSEILRDCAAKGLPVNDAVALQRYQRSRKGENMLMMGVMEGFKVLFAEPSPIMRLARNVGLSIVNRHTLLKEQIMKQAMGL